MDPWSVVSSSSSEIDTQIVSGSEKLVPATETEPVGLLSSSSIEDSLDSSTKERRSRSDSINLFEDHFVPVSEPNSDARQESSVEDSDGFQKLPDTQQYLASLERKLQKIQKGKDTPDGLIESLQQTREASLVNLLSNNAQLDSADTEEIRLNPILNKLIPEKSALTVEELVHLVQADQLSLSQEESSAGVEEITPVTNGTH